MCCLFGLIDYGHSFTSKQKAEIIRALATSAEVRGTDASGIAYNSGRKLRIYKRPVPGHRLTFRIPDDAAVIMGHARMTTQGSESRNCNNHPFLGQASKKAFALAHNGVLYNDQALRRSLKLPGTTIETDSYVAVQLVQKKRTLTFNSLKYMAERVEGSFAFTVLDERDHLYFVKGDNPLCICHDPERKLYLYASTEDILADALSHISLPLGVSERINIGSGDILAIGPDGKQKRSRFQFDDCGFGYWECNRRKTVCWEQDEYVNDLKAVAGAYGLHADQIDYLLAHGFTPEEIEEYLYCGEV